VAVGRFSGTWLPEGTLCSGCEEQRTAGQLARAVRMIEWHYGALLDGAQAGIAGRLDALEERLGQRAQAADSDV
jgi:hypothetical protein